MTAPEWTPEALTALVVECEKRQDGESDHLTWQDALVPITSPMIGRLVRECDQAYDDRSRLLSALRQLMAETRQPWRADGAGPYCRYCGQRHPEGRKP